MKLFIGIALSFISTSVIAQNIFTSCNGAACNGLSFTTNSNTGIDITGKFNSIDQGIKFTTTGAGILNSNPPTAVGFAYNLLTIVDKIDASAIAAGADNTNGLFVELYPKGDVNGTSQSLNNAITGMVRVIPSSGIGTTVEKGINGVWGLGILEDNLGGSNGNYKGAVFGMNAQAVAKSGATYLLGAIGMEIDVTTLSGSSMSRREGLTIVDIGSVIQGNDVDAALGIRSSGSGVGWKNGILFHDTPMDTGGKLIATFGNATVGYGIDISSYTFRTSAFKSNGFEVNGNGNINISSAPSSGSSFKVSSVTPSVSNGSNYALGISAVGGLVWIYDISTGADALYRLGGTGAALVSGAAQWSGGQSYISWDGSSAYRIYNNRGGASQYNVVQIGGG